MVIFPNAKINLGLCVTARRPDGYHDLATVMLPTGWCDVLEIVPGRYSGHTLTVGGRSVDCPPEKNLVMKAVRALERELGPLPPVDIYLEKIIPDGAGLGGGSADAAFTLRGLNQVLSLGLDDSRLAAIAATVGADCSFFIYNRPALCTGIGTDVSPIEIPSLSGFTLAIAKGRSGSVSTAEAYRGITPRRPDLEPLDAIALPPTEWRHRLVNDFEPTVFAALPDVARFKQHLYDAGAVYAAMSGSGSAVFGIFENDNLARRALDRLTDCDTWMGPALG